MEYFSDSDTILFRNEGGRVVDLKGAEMVSSEFREVTVLGSE